MPRKVIYPVVDIFAGPGGLGEGFSSLLRGKSDACFKDTVSVEQDEFAHRTLLLRHFLKGFKIGQYPSDYYDYLKGNITLQELFSRYPKQKKHADDSAIRVSLGAKNHDFVYRIISQRLKKHTKWVLVGGPPCQAYSLVGRSRMMGDPAFEEDERHFLYKEYLQIIIDHAPPVFVMENVKGILSARVKDELVINKVIADLTNPKDG